MAICKKIFDFWRFKKREYVTDHKMIKEIRHKITLKMLVQEPPLIPYKGHDPKTKKRKEKEVEYCKSLIVQSPKAVRH
jgi:hypothetical protein